MSADSSTGTGAEDLQFDRAIDPAAASPGNLVCSKCNAPIRMYYYHVNGETTCSTCKQSVERASGGAGKAGPGMMKALLFGLGAAVVGALIYYAVMEYLDLEIGYVAILIGFMVGYAVRNAVAGRGGRRFQVLAAGLTYFAVALAYAPFAIRGMDDPDKSATTADSVVAAESPAASSGATDAAASARAETSPNDQAASSDAADTSSADDPVVEAESLGAGGFALGAGGILLFILALPVIVIIGSMPGGIISAVIIGIGMRQAWTMTRREDVAITGPFKVGSEPPATAV